MIEQHDVVQIMGTSIELEVMSIEKRANMNYILCSDGNVYGEDRLILLQKHE